MGKEGRARRRDARHNRRLDAERVTALEQRIDELVTARDAVLAEVAQARADLDRKLEAQAAAIAQQHVETVAQAQEDYRRQVGVIDIVRRQQRRQDETFGARVDAAEAAVAALTAEQAARLAHLETDQAERLRHVEARTEQVDTTARMAIGRMDGFEAFQTDLGGLIERMNTTIRAIREAVEQLARRVEAAEAIARQQLGEQAELRERVIAGQQAADITRETAQRSADAVADLVVREQAISTALAALGPVPDRMTALSELVQSMNDRVMAAELLLNQRSDLDLQLERAEEFERVLAEVDPTAYALRADLDALRVEIATIRGNGHSE